MSVVDFNENASGLLGRDIGLLIHGELDGMLATLTRVERKDVRDLLDLIARKLADRSATPRGIRTRLEAVVANLIAVADVIDGDCDLEDGPDQEAGCEDEGSQCDDEGEPEDNGIADMDGEAEQRGYMQRQGGWIV
jgi:hypothetical protein